MLRKNLKDYNLNVFAELGNKYGIVTCGDKKSGFNCLTVSWGGFGVLWGKNVAYIFVRKSRYTTNFLEKSDSVTISFLDSEYDEANLDSEYDEAKNYLGTKSGRDGDKVKDLGLHYTYDPDYDGAYIAEASYCFKMKKLYSVLLTTDNLPKDIKSKYYSSGDEHIMYVCEIKQYLVKEE